tara:strand:+ start:76 stop:258 length:183 start_codon:yes stop_codon:yes gene_type:complete
MNNKTLLIEARKKVNAETFGTDEWESAMQIVRDLCQKINDAMPVEAFHSIDSGIHPTRYI